MIEQQIEWFKKLNEIRNKAAAAVNTFALKNMWDSVTEKYSDKAHFIYELLQNANDAKASKSSFYLTTEGLYFTHNGTKHFWVSNPDTEPEDQERNKLGDINAITAVAQSNKKDQDMIGKFGVGFKAVFQYTDTPYIYDKNFQFKIEKYIVPVILEEDLPNRRVNETVFYFPFNKYEMPAEKAYSDILEKLKRLVYPTLFSNNLCEISWKNDFDEGGVYQKTIKRREKIDSIVFEIIELHQEAGLDVKNDKIILFTRSIDNQPLTYSIGYFFAESNHKLIPKPMPAFCYYPTKVTTNLNFIIHAPFLLTDSREGIKEDQTEGWNEELISLLAHLAADSLLILRDFKLIDEDIIRIIPYKKSDFYSQSSYNPFYNEAFESNTPKFFAPFYDIIKKKLQTEEVLPSLNGEYVNSKNAYWASAPTLSHLFSNKQLSFLYENKKAKWIFPSLGYSNVQGTDKELASYISDLSDNNVVQPNTILGKINAEFTELQNFEWLHKLYDYLSENKSYQDIVKTKPIFFDGEGVPAAAFQFDRYSKRNEPILFLPDGHDENIIGGIQLHRTIHNQLLSIKNSKEFIENFGLKKPNLKDKIYNHILPLYEQSGAIDTEPHFKLFFKYWKEEGRPEDFIDLIKEKEFVSFKSASERETTYRGKAKNIYYPSTRLNEYFASKPDTYFVDLEDYYSFIEEDDKAILKEFLLKLGVKELPEILDIKITDINTKIELNLKSSTKGYNDKNETWDKKIDGCSEILDNIDKDKSILLWTYLGKMQHLISNNNTDGVTYFLNKELIGVHTYFYYSKRYQTFESTDHSRLKNEKWLLSKENKFVAPHEITINDLADGYDRNNELESFLGLQPSIILTEEEKIAHLFNNIEEAELAKELLEKHKANLERTTYHSIQPEAHNNQQPNHSNSPSTNGNSYTENERGKDYTEKKSNRDRSIQDLDELLIFFSPEQKSSSLNNTEVEKKGVDKNKITDIEHHDIDDNDEFTKGIEDLKTKLEIKKSRNELVENISKCTKYSYEWFKTYLKLLSTYGEKQDTTSQKSISFQEIKTYKTDNKYFLLRNPNSYISPEIENAEDFKITLVYGNGKKENITVEGVSKKGQDLLIYSREGLPKSTLNKLSTIFKITINFTPVIDLIDRLYMAFTNPNNLDSWENIQEEMPGLNYMYGPPGTGKTTKICKMINNILSENPDTKILVLTPTNKAADVVCKRLLDINFNIFITRLSSPTDPELDEAIYRDILELDEMININVVASTIHRLPYFNIINAGLLFQYKWDYIIFDESSMTGLHYITFAIMALYKTKNNSHFIISGDPKQIPPVVEIDDKELEEFDFQDENIYKMMGLKSFNPSEQIIREIDTIENLGTQYRSLPCIGQVFSDLSYSGLLKHNRSMNTNSKTLPDKCKTLISSNVAFIDLPLNKDNSIFRVNKLIYSSYHFYSAILVTEMIKYFDSINETEWSIGIITPYKAQAVLINKLVTSYSISEKTKVYSDTVHGFQGDECDIVFFVCNPNNYYYTANKKALLSKEYIYNVAISRAKDYLIIIHPFSKIGNNEFINRICYSYKTNFGNTSILSSTQIEEYLFNDKNYIENNSYVSGHDNVNIFGLSEMKYFIKANDTAIDIQLQHSLNNEDKNNGEITESNFIKTEVPKIEGLKVIGKIDLSAFEKYKRKK